MSFGGIAAVYYRVIHTFLYRKEVGSTPRKPKIARFDEAFALVSSVMRDEDADLELRFKAAQTLLRYSSQMSFFKAQKERRKELEGSDSKKRG